MPGGRKPKLTPEILAACLAGGLSNELIAEHVGVTLRTVRAHIRELHKIEGGRASLAVRDAVQTKSSALSDAAATVPDAPTPQDLHRVADRALFVAASMEGTPESVKAAHAIKAAVALPPVVEEAPTSDLIAAALAASRTAVEAAKRIRAAEAAAEAEPVQVGPDDIHELARH